jgi:hypothetical protein
VSESADPLTSKTGMASFADATGEEPWRSLSRNRSEVGKWFGRDDGRDPRILRGFLEGNRSAEGSAKQHDRARASGVQYVVEVALLHESVRAGVTGRLPIR